MAISPFGLPRAGRLPNFSQILRNTSGYRNTSGARGLGSYGTPTGFSAADQNPNQTPNPYGPGRPAATASPLGQIPDYRRLIETDPGYHQATLDAAAARTQAETTRSGQTQRALVGFGDTGDIQGSLSSLGLDPSSALYRNLLGDVAAAGPHAQALTEAGQSTTANLAREHALNIQTLLGNLGASGSLYSGDTGVGLGNEAQRYTGAQYGARQKVLDYLAGVNDAYAKAQQGVTGDLAIAAGTARTNIASLYPVAPNYGSNTTAPASPSPNPYQVGRNA